jgi:putative endonuclease
MSGASPAQPWWRRWFGMRSEHAAEKHLKGMGYKIVARNYKCPFGELDLVAVDGECVVFVEVRSTEAEDALKPAESVGAKKQDTLTKLAIDFLTKHRLLGKNVRFDVLAVSWPADERSPAINHYRNAFDASDRIQALF